MATIFGQNLAAAGSSKAAGSADIANNSFPKQLACVAVEIDGKRVPLSFVRPDQINVQAPTTASLGPVSVKVILNPDRDNQSASDAASVQFTAVAPGFFTLNSKSIAAQFANTVNLVADPSVVPGAKPAKAGDIVTVYLTGCGPTDPALQSGDVATAIAKTTATPTVMVGGTTLAPADLLYAGLSPGSISGLYQANIRIPAGTPDGDIPISLTIGGLKTQDGATIPIKN